MSELGLSEAIGQLRREIGASMELARNEPLQFRLGAVELELQVALAAKAGVKGEAKWVVVSFGADAGAAQAEARQPDHEHRARLVLVEPRRRAHRPHSCRTRRSGSR